VKESAPARRDRTVVRARAPRLGRHLGQSDLGGLAEGRAIDRLERPAQARDHIFDFGSEHGDGFLLKEVPSVAIRILPLKPTPPFVGLFYAASEGEGKATQ
jgi:hypothetical protein